MKAETPAKNDTRKQILDLAEELLLTRGYNAFSYQHISSTLGVRNAAIHYHFPKKNDLGVALVQRYRRRFARFVEAQGELPPLEQLDNYFALTVAYFHKDRQICPSGTLSTEYHTLPEDMQREAAAFVGEMRDWAGRIVARGREQGVMQFAGSPQAMGTLLFAAMQGALQLARLDASALETTRQQVRALLGLA